MYKVIISGLLFLPFLCFSNENFILSGQVKASENQVFYSPKTDTWRVQLQWMLPEGEVAKKGDLVAVFDSGSIQSKLEQEEVSLLAAEEELYRLSGAADQKLLEATFNQKRAVLLVEKAKIDASISITHLSEYDYQKYQLAYEKSVVVKIKADDNLKQAKVANNVSLTKQKLKIKKHKEQLLYHQMKLKKMSIYAERTGPVIYGNHPWTGEKVFVGMTAQPAWKIAEIPSMKGLFIEAWVHEVDVKYLKKGIQTTIILDAYPKKHLNAELTKLSTQPEQRKEWGGGVYYRSVFEFKGDVAISLTPGMSAQLELTGGGDE